MTHVFVVVRDRGVSDSLQAACDDAGFSTTRWVASQLAIAALRMADTPVVVCLFHGGLDHDCDDVLSAAPTLPAHVYLVINTHPHRVQRLWNVFTQRDIPVLPAPFDVNDLLELLADAAERASLLAESPRASGNEAG